MRKREWLRRDWSREWCESSQPITVRSETQQIEIVDFFRHSSVHCSRSFYRQSIRIQNSHLVMGLLTSSVCPLLNAQVPKENYNIYINQVVLAVQLQYVQKSSTIKVTPHKELCFFISTLCMFGFALYLFLFVFVFSFWWFFSLSFCLICFCVSKFGRNGELFKE